MVVGPILGDVVTWGLGIVLPAVFLVLLRSIWKSFTATRPWFVSLIVAAMTHLSAEGVQYVSIDVLAGLMTAYSQRGQK